MMSRALFLASFFCASVSFATAQNYPPASYRISFPDADHHEARIDYTLGDIGEAPVTFVMSRSSPGRYALHEFAKNVYDVRATGADEKPLAIERSEPGSWTVSDHGGAVTFSYTLFANRGDGTYSQISAAHAHLNMPATFIWAKGFEARPITLTISPASRRWKAATQLPPTRRAMQFTAPDLYYFLDSPIELSDFDIRSWEIGDGEARQTIRIAIHHEDEAALVDEYAEQAKKVVAEQVRIFGEAPRFDYGLYTFIADFVPEATGDGMEHRNSTYLTGPKSLFDNELAQINVLAHEFFHVWNVERLRPAALEPFDFEGPNPTTDLWFAEGFTSYYAPLTLARAGIKSHTDYLEGVSGTLSFILNSRARDLHGPMEMSLRALYYDAASWLDPLNTPNVFASYYAYGAMIGLALDLSLRERGSGQSLDDYMRLLWQTYGRTEQPYTHEDLKAALATLTGDAAFAQSFFARYIERGEAPDFARLLAQAGLKLEQKNPDSASAGPVSFIEDGKALIIDSAPQRSTPLYEASVDVGDEIVRVGRTRIDSADDWAKALARHKPGDETTLLIRRQDEELRKAITFVADQTLHIIKVEDAGSDDAETALTDAQRAFREAWLGENTSDAKDDKE